MRVELRIHCGALQFIAKAVTRAATLRQFFLGRFRNWIKSNKHPSKEAMQAAINVEKLKVLFQSFRDSNDSAFVSAAEAIIRDELAANHHHNATELRNALASRPQTANLKVLSRARTTTEDFLSISEQQIDPLRVVLTEPTQSKISRFLQEHERSATLSKFGLKAKSKLLFWGPPGCGKTLTARLISKELGLPIAVLRLSSVISSLVGDTAAHLQRVFNRAATTPLVLFLDEVDAIAKNRDDINDVGELKRVVNSILQALDSFDSSRSVVIAASNHQYLLDPAIWRRFDDVVEFPLPDATSREKLLRYLLSGVRVRGSLTDLSRKMSGMSFSDLEHVVIEALKTMVLQDRSSLTSDDINRELGFWRGSLRNAQKKPRSKSR